MKRMFWAKCQNNLLDERSTQPFWRNVQPFRRNVKNNLLDDMSAQPFVRNVNTTFWDEMSKPLFAQRSIQRLAQKINTIFFPKCQYIISDEMSRQPFARKVYNLLLEVSIQPLDEISKQPFASIKTIFCTKGQYNLLQEMFNATFWMKDQNDTRGNWFLPPFQLPFRNFRWLVLWYRLSSFLLQRILFFVLKLSGKEKIWHCFLDKFAPLTRTLLSFSYDHFQTLCISTFHPKLQLDTFLTQTPLIPVLHRCCL